ncbi:amino acid adenylation domain-containing protein [Prochlorococcus sp. MIT 1223]|uniref:amino acid adenylation domain-containing protein n=1 Tax=Prochlorococcus sp. MIT 1223 TaxID=3096217 RepID=UPI002A749D52|nr:amino acid adenylation domain-containing protein [Prochlorococcus sp. MIT 1223]
MWNYNLASRFESVVSDYSKNKAIVIDSIDYTYEELDLLSNKIAGYLTSLGISRGNVICLGGEKSFNLYSIVIACWKTGTTYFFVDTDSPISRIKLMIDRCNPTLMMGNDNFINLVKNHYKEIRCLSIKKNYDEIIKFSNNFKVKNIPGDTISYIMFTSGSTGEPNGVAVAHSSILLFSDWAKNEYLISSKDIISGLNQLFFDNSVFDIYVALLNGATLIPVKKSLLNNPNKVVKLLNDSRITIWFSVPSLIVFYLKFGSIKKDSLKNLRYIIFGGEGFPKSKLLELFNIIGDRVILSNVYGPTEATCICSSYSINSSDFDDIEMNRLAPIGTINSNFRYNILDKDKNQVQVGQVGELVLSGPHLSKGYFNNTSKTNQRFIQNPNNKNYIEIMYFTGDLVKLDSKNKLMYFCGRIDNQIKFMGYRIELGEIESCLNKEENINECCVLFGRKNNLEQITSFISTDLSRNDVLQILLAQLPTYMIPRDILTFKNLPKNQNGKIDRIKLAEDYYD